MPFLSGNCPLAGVGGGRAGGGRGAGGAGCRKRGSQPFFIKNRKKFVWDIKGWSKGAKWKGFPEKFADVGFSIRGTKGVYFPYQSRHVLLLFFCRLSPYKSQGNGLFWTSEIHNLLEEHTSQTHSRQPHQLVKRIKLKGEGGGRQTPFLR